MGSFIARYHELTKYDPRSIDRLGPVRWNEQPHPFKEMAGDEIVDLKPLLPFLRSSEPDSWAAEGLSPGGPVDLATIARISWFSAGINAIVQGTNPPLYLRATPSAGGLYPIELYWALFDVPGVEPGLYLFHSARMGLVPVWRGTFRGDLSTLFGGHPSLRNAPAMALLTGLFGRGAWRYKERAYRRILLDAGHLAGNLCLTAASEGLQSAPLPSFFDQGVSDLLFLDSEEEVPLLGIPLGRDIVREAPRLAHSPEPLPDQLRVPEGLSFQVHAHRLAALPQPPFSWLPLYLPTPQDPPTDSVLLPPATSPLEPHFHRTLITRRSTRSFETGSVPFATFARILRWAMEAMNGPGGLGIDPEHLSTWIVALDIEGLPPGIWKIDPFGRFLSLVRPGDFREACGTVCLGQALASDAAAVFFHTTDLDASVAASGERCYRGLCIDSGHIGQRLALAAHALELGFSGIGGYFDEEANNLLGLPSHEAVLYISTLGRP